MSLLFSSHLLPDVEAVCDHVLVLGGGRLLAQGRINELKQPHARSFEVRVKVDAERFAYALKGRGCDVEARDDVLVVRLPAETSPDLLWELASSSGEQIRYLRPQRSTLEEVFLKAIETDVTASDR
jgi:ABC-2 type transport system ATP-binding protein